MNGEVLLICLMVWGHGVGVGARGEGKLFATAARVRNLPFVSFF